MFVGVGAYAETSVARCESGSKSVFICAHSENVKDDCEIRGRQSFGPKAEFTKCSRELGLPTARLMIANNDTRIMLHWR